MTRSDIIEAARTFSGVPFRHQGRSTDGIDCIGLIVCTAILLGIDVKDRRDYSREPANFELPTELRKQLKLKCSALTVIKDCGCGAVTKKHASMDSAKPGDVVLFRFVNQPQHVGILTDRGVIHAFQPRMKVVEHTLDQKWSKRIVEIYEFPGVTD